MKHKSLFVSITIAIIVIGFFVGARYYASSEAQRIGSLSEENSSLFVREHSPRLGEPDAKVQLVEFLDPECESCRAFYPLVKKILADHEGEVQLIVRYAPFHQNSRYAIRILEATRKQDKYWESLEALFRHQPEWASHHDPKPELIWAILPTVGVDVEKVKIDMEDPEIAALIDQDIVDGVQLGVKATPTFFVNGKPLEQFGAEPLLNLIAAELKDPQ